MITRPIRTILVVLSTAVAGLTGLVTLGSPAFASVPAPGTGGSNPGTAVGGSVQPLAHAASGGMLGWQIALIAVGAALLAVVLTAYADRVRVSRARSPQPIG